MSKRKGIPGLRGAEHMGFTVPNIDAACEFFETVIGAQVLFSAGSFKDDDGDWMKQHVNVHLRAKIKEYRYLRCATGTNLEIFEYESPDQDLTPPKNSDIGGHHIAFYVDDIDAAIAHLKAHGVRVLGEPTKMTTGNTAGLTWVYFLTPWGMQLELVSENGLAYEKQSKTLLWHPKYPADRPY